MNDLIIQNANLNQICQILKDINTTILKGRLDRGYLLHCVKEQRLYVGHDSWVETWNDFLETINLPKETARQDIKIYLKFNTFLQENSTYMSEIPYERLVRLLPVAEKTSETKAVADMLEMAYTTNRKDFDNNVAEMKGLVPDDKCVNPQICDATKIILEKCTICGITYRREDLEV